MKKETLWIWTCIVCLITGALLCFGASLPYGTSLAEERGPVGPVAVVLAYALWLAEAKPGDLFFGIVVGGSLALIDKEKILLGLTGVALVCIARFIQLRVEKKDEKSSEGT